MADIWWHLCEHQARPRPQAPACISALSRGRAEAGVGPLLSLPSLQGAELRRNRHPLQSPCASPSAVGPWFPCPWGALLWAQPHRWAGASRARGRRGLLTVCLFAQTPGSSHCWR